jgi:hypothetical protein
VLSEKLRDMGEIELVLDGVSQGFYQLYQDPMPRLYQVPVFRKTDLPSARHAIESPTLPPTERFCPDLGDFVLRGEDQRIQRLLYRQRSWI